MQPTDNNEKILDLNIAGIERTKVRINGRNDSILELNLSDLNISERLKKGYAELQKCAKSVADLDTSDKEELRKAFDDIDAKMREQVDYIFDANVSEVCCKGGTMLDPDNGVYRFERIIEALLKLYSDSVDAEYKAMKKRIQQGVDKYLPQDHKPKAKKRKETQNE